MFSVGLYYIIVIIICLHNRDSYLHLFIPNSTTFLQDLFSIQTFT